MPRLGDISGVRLLTLSGVRFKLLSVETTGTARARFDAKTCPEPNSGCLLWLGAIDRSGYGYFWLAGRTGKAHRAAWEFASGPIPDGIHVLHHCDNPSCVERRHLFLGTSQDNRRDMALKDRGTKSKVGLPYGVSRSLERFKAEASQNGKQVYLGTYDTADEASAVAVAFRATIKTVNLKQTTA